MTSNVFSQNTFYDGFFTPAAMRVRMETPDRIDGEKYLLGPQEYIVTLTPGKYDKVLKTRNYHVQFNVDSKGVETGDATPIESDRDLGIKSKITKDPQSNGNMEIIIAWDLLRDTGLVNVRPLIVAADGDKFINTGAETHTPIYEKDKGMVVLLAKPDGKLVVERIVDEECSDRENTISVTIMHFPAKK